MNETKAWTRPYHGIQHLGQPRDRRWATVTDWGDSAELVRWWLGCGFVEPTVEHFPSIDDARKAGEAWVSGVN